MGETRINYVERTVFICLLRSHKDVGKQLNQQEGVKSKVSSSFRPEGQLMLPSLDFFNQKTDHSFQTCWIISCKQTDCVFT